MVKRKVGIGTISLPLALLGLVWSLEIQGFCLGDIVLNFIGLRAWTNVDTGLHLTVFYSLLFFVPALILSYKHKENIGSKIGRILSIIFIGLILLLTLFNISL
jgi:putative effector of murein hydrolase LrgA (UPF0299 family)